MPDSCDARYMRRAIELARNGMGWTSPNPMVGAVVVKGGRIIGEGWHPKCGELHAERRALAACTEDPAGGTIYVTLEPCCHQGRTPPCTEAILRAGLHRVVIGSRDPNPLVAGKGAALLREAGVQVDEDFLREECDALNPVFFHYITHKTPYVVMKYAMTADGKIACYTGASRWVSGEEARKHVQTLRHRYTGIMVGIGTVLADDPLLNCRLAGGKQPVRIVCDSSLRIPDESQIVRTAGEYPTIVAAAQAPAEKRQRLEERGVTVWELPGPDGRVDLPALMTRLGQREIDSLLLEGGGALNEAMLRAGLVQEVKLYLAPKLFGGRTAPTPVSGQGVDTPENCWLLEWKNATPLGQDILLEYQVRPKKSREGQEM